MGHFGALRVNWRHKPARICSMRSRNTKLTIPALLSPLTSHSTLLLIGEKLSPFQNDARLDDAREIASI